MSNTQDMTTIERDLLRIDQALNQVSNVKSTLKHFTQLVEQEQKGPSYIQVFSDRLKNVKQELNRLAIQGNDLKDVLNYAQSVANAGDFDWSAIKSEKQDQRADKRKPEKIGSIVKDKADYAYKQLSLMVFDHSTASIESFFTTYTQQWLSQNKDQTSKIDISFEREEQPTLSGTTCHLKVCIHKAFIAELELEYARASNTLIVHQHDIRGLKEEKQLCHGSQYLVFQKLSLLAAVAFEDMTTLFARESFFHILDWLVSYHDLFTAPCIRCHKVLQFDSPVYKYTPPIVRTWYTKHTTDTTALAYHMRCYHEHKNSRTIALF